MWFTRSFVLLHPSHRSYLKIYVVCFFFSVYGASTTAYIMYACISCTLSLKHVDISPLPWISSICQTTMIIVFRHSIPELFMPQATSGYDTILSCSTVYINTTTHISHSQPILIPRPVTVFQHCTRKVRDPRRCVILMHGWATELNKKWFYLQECWSSVSSSCLEPFVFYLLVCKCSFLRLADHRF